MGVFPKVSFVRTLLPLSRSCWTIALCPFSAARWSGVTRYWSDMLASAPSSSSCRTRASWPFHAAQARAVAPNLSRVLISGPLSSNGRIVTLVPFHAIKWSAVWSRLFGCMFPSGRSDSTASSILRRDRIAKAASRLSVLKPIVSVLS